LQLALAKSILRAKKQLWVRMPYKDAKGIRLCAMGFSQNPEVDLTADDFARFWKFAGEFNQTWVRNCFCARQRASW
jgi:hypothetical protein